MAGKNESIKVFVRVRPPILDEICESAAVHVSNNTINLYSEKHNFSCGFDSVFDETSSQANIFQDVKPLLKSVLRGENMCIFAYGQTNSGKSYTMIGPEGGQKKGNEAATVGLIPRISQYLINNLRRKLDSHRICSFQVKVSFLQIYNEVLIDLLRDNNTALSSEEKEEALKIREIPRSRNNPGGEVYVAGLSEFRVQTVEDIMKIIKIGNSNRITNNSYYNNNSSRSHAILQLFFEIERYADDDLGEDDNNDADEGGGGGEEGEGGGEYSADRDGENTIIYRSKLNLIDLAGSEKIDTNYNAGGGIYSGNGLGSEVSGKQHIRELTSINKSLMCLSNIIAILANKSKEVKSKAFGKESTFVPYRDSKLTRILQDSLGGSNGRTLIIACLTPLQQNVGESINTLNFADKAKNVMLKIKVNSLLVNGGIGGGSSGSSDALIKAENELKRLRTLLQHYMKAADMGESSASGEDKGGGPGYFAQVVDENNRLKIENEKLKKELKKALKTINSVSNSNNHNSNSNSSNADNGRKLDRLRASYEADTEEPSSDAYYRPSQHQQQSSNHANNSSSFPDNGDFSDQYPNDSFEYSPTNAKRSKKKAQNKVAAASSKSSINAYISGNPKYEKQLAGEEGERPRSEREMAMGNMRYVSPIYSQSGPPGSNNFNSNSSSNSNSNSNYTIGGGGAGGVNSSNLSSSVGINVNVSNNSLGGNLMSGGLAGMSANQVEAHLAQLNPSSNRLESLIHKGLSSLLVKQGAQPSQVNVRNSINQWPPGHPLYNTNNNNNNSNNISNNIIINNNNNANTNNDNLSNSSSNNVGVGEDPNSNMNYLEGMRRKLEASNNVNQNLQYNSELILASNSINKTLSKEKEDLMKIQKKREKLEKELQSHLKSMESHGQNGSNSNNLGKSVDLYDLYESDSFEEEGSPVAAPAAAAKSSSSTTVSGSQQQASSSSSSSKQGPPNRMAAMRQSIASASVQQSIPSPVKAANPTLLGSYNNPDNGMSSGVPSLVVGGVGGGDGSALKSKYTVSNDTIANVMQAAGLHKVKVPVAGSASSHSTGGGGGGGDIYSGSGGDGGGGGGSSMNEENSSVGETSINSQQRESNVPANLKYSQLDINRVIQLYSFRMNKWENILIEDYNSSNSFHKVKFIGENNNTVVGDPSSATAAAAASKGVASQWIDLKKKPIREKAN